MWINYQFMAVCPLILNLLHISPQKWLVFANYFVLPNFLPQMPNLFTRIYPSYPWHFPILGDRSRKWQLWQWWWWWRWQANLSDIRSQHIAKQLSSEIKSTPGIASCRGHCSTWIRILWVVVEKVRNPPILLLLLKLRILLSAVRSSLIVLVKRE